MDADSNGALRVVEWSHGTTLLAAPAEGAAAAAVTATLTPSSGKVAFITGFHVTTTNPAAPVTGKVTVTGLTGPATLNFELVESATAGGQLLVTFPKPIPASGADQAIAVVVPAITSGGKVTVNAYGFESARTN